MDSHSTQKTPQTSLEHSRQGQGQGQPNFAGSFGDYELSQTIMPLHPQECPNETDLHFRSHQPPNFEFSGPSQNNQNGDTGASVQLVTPYRGDNDDLLSVYLHGLSQSNNQNVFQGNQVGVMNENIIMPIDNRPINNHYNVTTVPTEIPLPRQSFSPMGQGFGTPQLPAPSGLSQDNLAYSNMLHSNQATPPYLDSSMMHGYPAVQRPSVQPPIIPQENPNIMNIPSHVMNQGSCISPYYGSTYNMPIGVGQPSTHQGSIIPQHKRKLIWQDDNVPNCNKRMGSILWGDQGQTSAHSTERFTLYDSRYEDIGIPVDPHLRIFNASKGTGN